MSKIDFAFLVHPRQIEDIYIQYPLLRFLNRKFLSFLIQFMRPVVGPYICGGLDIDGNPVNGRLIIVPLTAHQMLQDKDYAKKKVIDAVALSNRLGAKVVGLGALTSSVTNGGTAVLSQKGNAIITSGNSLTVNTTFKDVKYIIEKRKISGPIAIVGATGSIGRALSFLLSKSKEIENDLILIGKTPSKVDELKDSLLGSIRKIRAGVDINEIHKADIILICTSSHDAVVHQHMVKSGVVIYDVTQPKNTSKELQHRKDLSYIDGGYISAPESIYKS